METLTLLLACDKFMLRCLGTEYFRGDYSAAPFAKPISC
jgi:hypothetical protein